MAEHKIEGNVEQHHLDRLDEMTPELQERADKFREQVEPKLLPVTTEYVKERLLLLAGLIQEHRELDGKPRLGGSEIGAEVRRVVKEQPNTAWGTRLEKVESAIGIYERAVDALRRDRAVTDSMDELFAFSYPPEFEAKLADEEEAVAHDIAWQDHICVGVICPKAHPLARWIFNLVDGTRECPFCGVRIRIVIDASLEEIVTT